MTWQAYGDGLEDRLTDLHGRIHRGAYQAKPSRRVWIPKADGRKRPFFALARGIAASRPPSSISESSERAWRTASGSRRRKGHHKER